MTRIRSAAIASLLEQVAMPAEVLRVIQAPQFELAETMSAKDWRRMIPLPMRAHWKCYSLEAQLAAYIVAFQQTIDER